MKMNKFENVLKKKSKLDELYIIKNISYYMIFKNLIINKKDALL